MSDNVIEFPKAELDIDVELEIDDDMVVIEGVTDLVDIMLHGFNSAHEVTPEHIMTAMMQLAVIWGFRAGMTPDEIMDLFKRMRVRLEDEDDG
jgi:hypothetical protein